MRRFTLINKTGAAYDLNSRDSFFHDPEGLGFEDATSFIRIGSTYRPVREELKQGEIRGSIFFPSPDAYRKYREFASFLRNKPLKLKYDTDGTYYIELRAVSLEKTELKFGGAGMDVPVKFLSCGLWYRNVHSRANWDSEGGKVYGYKYNYKYRDGGDGTLLIDSDSSEDSPCMLTVFGPCRNPRWSHYVDGEPYATGYYPGYVAANRKLIVDSTVIPFSIKEYTLDDRFMGDRYQDCDFSTERFIHLQAGRNRIKVIDEDNNIIRTEAEGHLIYETV